jgi:hypothetical protein
MPIDTADQETISQLFKTIYKLTSLNHVTVEGNDYYNRANTWDSGNKDDDEMCDGYSECEFDSPEELDGAIIYHIDCDFEFINECKDFADDPENLAKMESVLVHDSKAKLFDVPDGTVITLINRDGFNKDHRGSDHTAIALDFHESYDLEENNLESLVDALYRIKSHKFDKWYELYTGVSEINIQHNTVEIVVTFDHGS